MKEEEKNNAYFQKERTLELSRIVTLHLDFVQFLVKVVSNAYVIDIAAHPNRIENYSPPGTH